VTRGPHDSLACVSLAEKDRAVVYGFAEWTHHPFEAPQCAESGQCVNEYN